MVVVGDQLTTHLTGLELAKMLAHSQLIDTLCDPVQCSHQLPTTTVPSKTHPLFFDWPVEDMVGGGVGLVV